MDILLYYLFSSVEYVAMFILTFRLFRLSLAGTGWRLVLACLLLTNVDQSVRFLYDAPEIAPLVQLVLMFFLMWLLFGIHPFYASFVGVTGYMLYVSVANFWISLLPAFGVIDIADLSDPNHIDNRLLQCATAFTTLLSARIIQVKGWGFNFVPDDQGARVRLTWTNRFALANVLLSAFVVAVGYYVFLDYRQIPSMFISLAFWIALALLLYLSKRKNEE